MSLLICKECGAEFQGDAHGESPEFDAHNCPAIPEPIKGESLEGYKARCKALRSIMQWNSEEVQP